MVKKRRKKIQLPKLSKKILAGKKIKKKLSKPAKKSPVFDNTIHKTKIRVIGIGGGGGSIVSEIVSRIKKADFVVANTDIRALRAVRQVRRFQFGQSLTKGLGTGMNADLGELAAQNEKEKIKKLFEGQDLCIMVSCLGGGAGSGATPVFAKISKNSDCLTYGIFTLPFEFEGEKKMEIAKESLEKIRPNLNAYSIIPNERIFQIIDKDTPLKDALSAINERLAENLEGLIGMIYLPGLINIDFADLKTILSGRGRLTYLNTIEIEDPDKENVVKKVTSSPLYSYTIKGARRILYNIIGGKMLQLSEVSQLSKIISDSINKNAKIIFGINQDQKYQEKIKITLLATGCGIKGFSLKSGQRANPRPVLPKRVNPVRDSEDRDKPKKQPISNGVKSKKRRPKKEKPEADRAAESKNYATRPRSGKTKIISSEKKLREKKMSHAVSRKKTLIKKTTSKVARTKTGTKIRPKKVIPKIKIQPKKEKKKTKEPVRYLLETKPMAGEKVRRNALQLKKVIEQEEKELLEKEKSWETPAILRRRANN